MQNDLVLRTCNSTSCFLPFLGEIYLFCKGADSSIFPRVIEGKVDQIRARVERNAVVRWGWGRPTCLTLGGRLAPASCSEGRLCRTRSGAHGKPWGWGRWRGVCVKRVRGRCVRSCGVSGEALHHREATSWRLPRVAPARLCPKQPHGVGPLARAPAPPAGALSVPLALATHPPPDPMPQTVAALHSLVPMLQTTEFHVPIVTNPAGSGQGVQLCSRQRGGPE